MLRRYELTDQEWKQIAHLFPPENTGKPGGTVFPGTGTVLVGPDNRGVNRYFPQFCIHAEQAENIVKNAVINRSRACLKNKYCTKRMFLLRLL